MKKILISIFSTAILSGCVTAEQMQFAAPLNDVSEVIDINGKSKDQLFEASKIWIAKSFNSSNNVIQYADKESGSIIGKGNMKFPCDGFIDCSAFGNDRVNFTIKIDTKDNKARVTLSDITRTPLTYINGGLNTNIGKDLPITQVKQQQQVKPALQSIIRQYKSEVTSQTNQSNW
ncbi:DUF4468 domain-containing protein [Acinetobacter sp. ANC 4631]